MELVVEVHFLTRRDCFSWRKGKRVGALKSQRSGILPNKIALAVHNLIFSIAVFHQMLGEWSPC